MDVMIRETGDIKQLHYHINGIDAAMDFIGNNTYNPEINADGIVVMSQDDYDWWKRVIIDHAAKDRLIDVYVQMYSREEVEEALEKTHVLDVDIDLQLGSVRYQLAKWFDEDTVL